MNFLDLKEKASEIGVNLTDEKIKKLELYSNLLIETNKVINLTAITDISDIIEKHFFDSLTIFKLNDFANKTLIDIGTGAGFPGVVIAICESTCKVSLLDSTTKKINFLKELCKQLSLDNVSFINKRVEELSEAKECFDFATARAFSSLPTLIEVAIPLLKVDGKLISMKGSKADEEIAQSKSAMKYLDCSVCEIDKFKLPFSNEARANIVIKKNTKTNKRYPRKWADICSKPL